MDTKLISRVEKASGSLVHEANNLLHCYKNWCSLRDKLKSLGKEKERQEAQGKIDSAEVRLRMFLFKISRP